MHPLTNEIIASREWRMRELEDLKKVGILALNTYPQKVKNQYYRMCIPYIYAHWEDRALYIDPALLTAKSNLNYKQLVVILGKFGMENCLTKYQGEINQLVNQRNRIAHGENGITVEYVNISDKISMLQEIFDLMILKFEEYLSERMYLK